MATKKLTDGMKVVPPNTGRYDNLTIGAEYIAEQVDTHKLGENPGFYIKDDGGHYIYCLQRYCSHIDYANWKLIIN